MWFKKKLEEKSDIADELESLRRMIELGLATYEYVGRASVEGSVYAIITPYGKTTISGSIYEDSYLTLNGVHHKNNDTNRRVGLLIEEIHKKEGIIATQIQKEKEAESKKILLDTLTKPKKEVSDVV